MAKEDFIAATIAGLAQAWGNVPFPSTDPISEEEIASAERELGVAFPRSYRIFLQQFGAGFLNYYEIFGLPRDRLWGNVVMMNQAAARPLPAHYIRFAEDVGEYSMCLDTSRMDSDGECPVVVFGLGEEGRTVADSFLDFLHQANEGSI